VVALSALGVVVRLLVATRREGIDADGILYLPSGGIVVAPGLVHLGVDGRRVLTCRIAGRA
jgi:hypothetical protein